MYSKEGEWWLNEKYRSQCVEEERERKNIKKKQKKVISNTMAVFSKMQRYAISSSPQLFPSRSSHTWKHYYSLNFLLLYTHTHIGMKMWWESHNSILDYLSVWLLT